ncbi:hypothetical protein KC332_g9488 [Hortaea werneckii]|nr:hypothetical protein KC358_g6076 [Hortaea werneckii]KAI6845548.1 hypothetical protein KC350_g4387 [Hortaea werneckii]KAI6934634.1 hypothetical protein KC348_g6432 [Hortaea werneckii]KAI6936937.1 hypothetical protein KC341_g5920 [Hortaea werneckii]KAI6972427.1 hypothetical protein KC321_g6234 [Hortaea werneckii]
MPPQKAQTDICHACTMAGRADCDMEDAWVAGRDACSYCEQVRAGQIKNGARKLRECHPTTTTLADAAAMQAQSAPGLVGQQRGGYGGGWRSQRAPGPARQQRGGYGAGWGSGGYGMPPMPPMPQMMGYGGYGGYGIPQMPPMMGYGGYGMPPPIQPSVSQGGERKGSEDDATDDDQDDDLDRQIREAKKKKTEQDKRRQLRELEQENRRAEEEDLAREETARQREADRREEWARHQERARQDADRYEALARQRQRDAYDEERRINESYREGNRRGWDRDRSRSPISRSERQQVVRRRSPPPDPNSMVDWQRRSRNVESQFWMVNQRIDRERRAHEIEARATRQALDARASGGDVNMMPPPTGPRPGGKKRQKKDRGEQEKGTGQAKPQAKPQSEPQSEPRSEQTQGRPPVQGADLIEDQQQQQQQLADDGDVDMDVYQPSPPPAIDDVMRRTAAGQNPLFGNALDAIIENMEEEVEKEDAEAERKKAQGGEK